MDTVIKTLLEVSLLSSVMIISVMAVRTIWPNKINARIISVLWILVLIRLILPATFESPLHFDSLMPRFVKEEKTESHVAQEEPFPADGGEDYPAFEHETGYELLDTSDMGELPQVPARPTFWTKVKNFLSGISKWMWAGVVWLVGAAYILAKAVLMGIRFSRKTKRTAYTQNRHLNSLLEEAMECAGLRGRVAIFQSRQVDVPVVFGVARPRIIIPARLYASVGEDKLKLIILHELCHIKRGDIAKNILWLIAKALHWFNPLVWIAYNMQINDIELACDDMVMAKAGKKDGFIYSQSLLDVIKLSKGAEKEPVALSFCESKNNIRKRVMNMINPQRKLKSAGFISLLTAAVLIIGCFTTACRPTPDTPVVVNKNDGKLEEMIGQENPAAETEQKETEISLVEKVFKCKDDKVTVNINAQVELPSSVYPVVKIAPKDITVDFVKGAVEVLMEGKAVFEPVNQATKAEIQEEITKLQATLADPENSNSDGLKSGDPKAVAEVTEMFKQRIEIYKSMLQNAPESVERRPAVIEFKPYKYYADQARYQENKTQWQASNDPEAKQLLDKYENKQKMVLEADLDNGYKGTITAENYSSDGLCSNKFTFRKTTELYGGDDVELNLRMASGEYQQNAVETTLSTEQAHQMAYDLMNRLNIDDMVITHTFINTSSNMYPINAMGEPMIDESTGKAVRVPEDEIKRLGYHLYLQREYNGIAAKDSVIDAPMLEEAYGPTYMKERIEITISGDEITLFLWESPSQIVEVENQNVQMLTLDEAVNKFEKQMSLEYNMHKLSRYSPDNPDYDEIISRMEYGRVDITEIELCMIRIPIKNQIGIYRMIPAWKFYGDEGVSFKDSDAGFINQLGNNGLTTYQVINAVDGSIINPLGY